MVSLEIIIQAYINIGKLTEDEVYALWQAYWDDTETGNFVFPMETLDFQLEQYPKIEIVRMLQSPSSFSLTDKWGYLEFQFPHDRLSSSNNILLCVDWKDIMRWVDDRHIGACPDGLWDIYKSYKRNDN